MKLVIKVAIGVFLGIAAILAIRPIPGWAVSAHTASMKTQKKIDDLNPQVAQESDAVKKEIHELEHQIWELETPTQRKRQTEFAKQLANMTPKQLIAACGQPDKITLKKEPEDMLRTLEYDGYVEMGFRYPNDPDVGAYLGSTDNIPDHSIGSWAWGQEIAGQLPCVKKMNPSVVPMKSTQAVEPGPDLKIVSVNYKIVDDCGVWPCVDWKVQVANQTNRTLRLMGRVKFLDDNDYMVDLGVFTGYIDGGQSHTFTGQVTMPESDADRIESARAGITDYY